MLALTTVFILQILFESLPISSSGHLMLLHQLGIAPLLLPLQNFCAHVPTLLILIIFFAKQWYRQITKNNYKDIARFIFIADALPVLAYCLKIPHIFITMPIYWGFMGTMIMLLVPLYMQHTYAEHGYAEQSAEKKLPTHTDALLIGVAQTAALCIPGLSRLAATYAALRLCKINAQNAFSFSWLIQVPLLSAAAGKCLLYAYNHGDLNTVVNMLTNTDVLAATVGAIMLLAASAYCAAHNYFWLFALYMLVPLIASLILSF